MILRFEEWLAVRQEREDFIGEFARVLGMQVREHQGSRRKSQLDEHKIWADIVIRMPQPGYIDAFNEAWREFLLAKQAAKESAEGEAAKTAIRSS